MSSVQVIVKLPSIKGVIRTLNKADMKVVGFKTKELVDDQVLAQRDKRGKTFPRYSPRYQKVRATKGLPSGVVDLTITGHMLRSIDVLESGETTAVVGLNNTEAKRSAIGVLENKKRPIAFIGLTKKSQKELVKFYNDKYVKPGI